jgi:hypothetical protein
MNAKGISGILGALVLILVLVGSLSIFLLIQRDESNVFVGQQRSISQELRYSPIVEFYSPQGIPMLMSTSNTKISYVIYPSGEVKAVNIPVNSTPLDATLVGGNYVGWFLVVTNNGEEYNVTDYIYQPSFSYQDGSSGVGVSRAVNLTNNIEELTQELYSLPFFDVSGVYFSGDNGNFHHYYDGISLYSGTAMGNVTLIYPFPSNESFCILASHCVISPDGTTVAGQPIYYNDTFGIFLTTSVGNYFLYFYFEGQNCFGYPSGNSENSIAFPNASFAIYWNCYYYDGGGLSVHHYYTALNSVVSNSKVIFTKVSLQDDHGEWYITLGSGSLGVTYEEPSNFYPSPYQPVGEDVPLGFSGGYVYMMYLMIPNGSYDLISV